MDLSPAIRMPVKRRRRHSPQFKAQVLEESSRPGTSVAAIARHHGLNANLIHKWRKAPPNEHPVGPAFIPLPTLPTPARSSQHEVRVEVPTAKGGVTLFWPCDQPGALAQFIKSFT